MDIKPNTRFLVRVDRYHNQIYQVDVKWNYSVLAHYIESRFVIPCSKRNGQLFDEKKTLEYL